MLVFGIAAFAIAGFVYCFRAGNKPLDRYDAINIVLILALTVGLGVIWQSNNHWPGWTPDFIGMLFSWGVALIAGGLASVMTHLARDYLYTTQHPSP